MPRQSHEARYDCSMTALFAALVAAAGRGRWREQSALLDPQGLPVVGCLYVQRRGSVLRRGKVVECLRPVLLTLQETLLDPPCCVNLRLRWRLEPLESESLALLDARYTLNGAATIRARHWRGRIEAHCRRMLEATRAELERAAQGQCAGVSGQRTGNAAITSTNSSTVSGSPSLK